MVGRCAKQKKNISSVRHIADSFLFYLLGVGFCKMKGMKIAIALLFFVGLMSCEKKAALQTKMASPYSQPVVNQLPTMLMMDKDKNITDASKLKGKNIIILFFPDCDHCQREATEIAERIKSFDGYTLYFLSINPFTEILKFAETYHLTAIKNVKFVQTTGDAVFNNFGSVPTPSMYIYDNGKLVKKFNGETRVDEIVNYL